MKKIIYSTIKLENSTVKGHVFNSNPRYLIVVYVRSTVT